LYSKKKKSRSIYTQGKMNYHGAAACDPYDFDIKTIIAKTSPSQIVFFCCVCVSFSNSILFHLQHWNYDSRDSRCHHFIFYTANQHKKSLKEQDETKQNGSDEIKRQFDDWGARHFSWPK
jgi:hypothetical protein